MMTEQERLLLNVLSAMYPHGVVLHFDDEVEQGDEVLHSIRKICNRYFINDAYYLGEVKPYLRSLSSMTEDERKSLYETMIEVTQSYYPDPLDFSKATYYSYTSQTLGWLNENKFDYIRDKEGKTMIERGLALEAPVGMYNN